MTIIAGYLATPEGEAAVQRAGEEAILRRRPLVVVDLSDRVFSTSDLSRPRSRASVSMLSTLALNSTSRPPYST